MNENIEQIDKNEQHINGEELHPWEIGHDTNPIEIDEVVVRPTLDLTDRKRDMDYYLEPHKWLNNHNIARTINSGYINTDQIYGWNPSKLKYRHGTYENRQAFRTAKQNARHNKRMLKQAMRYAGSDQQSISDRHFYQSTLPTVVGIGTLGPTVGAYAVGNLLGAAAYTAPIWVPWVAKNIALPWLGGEVVNGFTNWMTDGKYDSFGDWIYNETPLNKWTKGTWLEQPTRFVADIPNLGYWAPYSKISTSLFHSIPNWVEGKAYGAAGNVIGAQLFKNPTPEAWTAAEKITYMVPQQHRSNFVQGVQKGNQEMYSLHNMTSGTKNTGEWFATGGMPNPQTTFYSGVPIFRNKLNFSLPKRNNFGKRSPFMFGDYDTVIDLPEINQGIKMDFPLFSTEIIDPTIQSTRQIKPASLNVKFKPDLDHFTYLSQLSQSDKTLLSTFSPKDQYLANRLFKFLDKEGLLGYYRTLNGNLTFTPDEEILHLTTPRQSFVRDVFGKRNDPNWNALRWQAIDKWRKETLNNMAHQEAPIDYNTLYNFDQALIRMGYYDKDYSWYKPENIEIPDMSSAWLDLDLQMSGARMYHRNQMLERARRRVKWPMRRNNLTAEERIGIPKHERHLVKRPNIGESLNSDLLLYRVTSGHPSIVGSKIQHISSGPGFIRDLNGNITFRRPMQNTSHWTSADLVQSHIGGNWDDKNTVLINSIRNIAKENGYPISLEPMDTFFSTQTPVIPTEGLTVITNSPSAATIYKLMGAKTFLNMRKSIVPSIKTEDFLTGLEPEHPYSYLWPHEYIPQTADLGIINSRRGISKPYDIDTRLGGYRNRQSHIEDYKSISDQMDDPYLTTSVTSTDDGINYEGLPKDHSAWPNGPFPLDGLVSFNWDFISPYYKKQYFDTLKRAINKGTIKISEEQKQKILDIPRNSSVYEYIVDAFEPYKK